MNTTLIDLYRQIGETIRRRVAAPQWCDGAVDQLASYIARWELDIRGFVRSNLLRMRQIYDTYRRDDIVAPLVRQIPGHATRRFSAPYVAWRPRPCRSSQPSN